MQWAQTLQAVTDSVLAECVDLDPDDTTTRRRGSDGRSVWMEPSARHHTSSEVLAQEEHIICWAMDAQLDPPAPSTGVNTGRLDVMQAEAAAAVAGSDRVVLVVGPAGAGKTTMLAAVRRAASGAGFHAAWGLCRPRRHRHGGMPSQSAGRTTGLSTTPSRLPSRAESSHMITEPGPGS